MGVLGFMGAFGLAIAILLALGGAPLVLSLASRLALLAVAAIVTVSLIVQLSSLRRAQPSPIARRLAPGPDRPVLSNDDHLAFGATHARRPRGEA